MLPTIQLSNGKYYDFTAPDPDVLDIEVIGLALGFMCRFTGHTSRFYSVAEHCVRCSYIGPDDEALERLMHDAAEALVVDLPSPIKRQPGMETYLEYDRQAEACVAAAFRLRYPWPPSVKVADLIMLATEKRDLLPRSEKDAPWAWLDGVTPLPECITEDDFRDPFEWGRRFVWRFNNLAKGR